MLLRDYQQRTLDELYQWWVDNPGGTPLVVVPTGGGKSVIIAELCRLLFDTWPEAHPRTVVLVPSKELAEQNAAKLAALLPTHLKVGYYSASIGRKQPDADVIVATIGSVYRAAHLLGNIKCVVIDEAHLVNPDGAGRYRAFLRDLAKYCRFRVVGYTATPFRGDGVWLTDGDDPLFDGVASRVTVAELLERGYLALLAPTATAVQTRIDTSGISTSAGDYAVDDLAERVQGYLPHIADEAVKLAADRRKWIAFCVNIANAHRLAGLLNERGIDTAVVTGETPKREREQAVADFRAGRLRCLVTVLALATGFDVPDVDCILWCRPTISPVLYVQGAGRGFRTAPGKTDCLWLDFSDTTERLGPVDTIKGRKRSRRERDDPQGPPMRTCDECGTRMLAALTACPTCGHPYPKQQAELQTTASAAAVLSIQQQPRIVTYPVTQVTYSLHRKDGKPDSMRVDYFSGIRRVATEWVCPLHGGFAGEKARRWLAQRGAHYDPTVTLRDWIAQTARTLRQPSAIVVNETGQYPEIVQHQWGTDAHEPRSLHPPPQPVAQRIA